MSSAAAAARGPSPAAAAALRDAEAAVARVIRDKDRAIRMAFTTLLARGHLLIEDIPGVGKTTLARAVAAAVGGTFRRIQFTSDLLPSDIVGTVVFKKGEERFEFRRGPIFANVVLADEINRTTPRTQSALLEAMSEGQVTVDDQTHDLGNPFLVIATQNPTEHFGTYPLPESQMDRFLLRMKLGYPGRSHELDILRERSGGDPVDDIESAMTPEALTELQDAVHEVRVDDSLLEYAMNVIDATRDHPSLAVGVSTRGALSWYRAAQASAVMEDRGFVVPDDFKDLAVAALSHRVHLARVHDSPAGARAEAESIIADIVSRQIVPT